MFHPTRLPFYALGALLLSLASCSNPTAPSPELEVAKNLAATAGGKSVTLTWDAVPNATGYTVWYTSDGSAPTNASSSAVASGTTLTQTSLDETRTYKYAVQPTASGYTSKLSASVAVQPLNVITFTIGQAGANQAVVIQPFYAAGTAVDADWTNGTYTKGTPIYNTADANGSLTLVLTINRVNQWGWTVALDKDNSHTITTGDEVWGSGTSGVFTFLYIDQLLPNSRAESYTPWNAWTTTPSSHFY